MSSSGPERNAPPTCGNRRDDLWQAHTSGHMAEALHEAVAGLLVAEPVSTPVDVIAIR